MNNKISKKTIFDTIQIGNHTSDSGKVYDVVIVATIVVNISIMFMQTFQSLSRYYGIMHNVENVTYLILIAEYIASIWTADFRYPDRSPGQARLKFLLSFDGIVELLTILPFFFLDGFIVLQMLRIVRIFHLFRINAVYDSFNVIANVLYAKKNQLLSSIFIILVLITAASLCMYSVENKAQPDVFRNAFSGIWWGVSTIFTVGYGDMYPVTMLGRTMAVVITFLGVGAVAIPTGIISAGFVEKYGEMQRAGRDNNMLRTSTLIVDDKSVYLGKKAGVLYEEFGLTLSVIIRDGAVTIPAPELIIKAGDMLVYHMDFEEDL